MQGLGRCDWHVSLTTTSFTGSCSDLFSSERKRAISFGN